MGNNRYVCIHGHWYQPPRENPFTGKIEAQPGAAPFDNWNERITAECYQPNSNARVLGPDGGEQSRINNYGFISSDWGPTLLRWLESNAPETYTAILEADRTSIDRFDGHGGAIAHAYNHTILPLSNSRDKLTQVVWGIADFRHRFGREPEGMWLPETAVDLESLDYMAGEGIRFTILSPYQAQSVVTDEGEFDVGGGRIDTSAAYRVDLPSGREIAVFFYDGPMSQEIAFDGLLEDGVRLANRLAEATVDGPHPALSHVATDGESYGHHHRFGEMALARAILTLDADPNVTLTNYARFLALSPPRATVRIVEDSSWSCAHGVERWRSDCGCAPGDPGWNQAWRAPLRAALDELRDMMASDFEEIGGGMLSDPWRARDAYIEVMLGTPFREFLAGQQSRPLTPDESMSALDLLEIQMRSMFMYTSCGWFFEDITRLESVFVMRQAARAIELTRGVTGRDLEPAFLGGLERAVSNEDGITGRDVYMRWVAPYMNEARPAQRSTS